MSAGISGRLISTSFIRDLLPSHSYYRQPPAASIRALETWHDRCEALLGPAASVRAIADVAVTPLLRILELDVRSRTDSRDRCIIRTTWTTRPGPDVLVVGWNESLSHAWRDLVRDAVRADARWTLCTNGVALRIVDARRTWSRAYLELDLTLAATTDEPRAMLWTFVHGSSIASPLPPLDLAIGQSDRHGADVCRALGQGVLEALMSLLEGMRMSRPTSGSAGHASGARTPLALDHALTVVYRLLFLLFAEARGLVPIWHPVYRNRYSVDAIVAVLLEGRPCRGLWAAVRAISRLAQTGCTAGELHVNAFNGHLFSAAASASFDGARLSDRQMSRVIMALGSSSQPGGGGVRRIMYRDLDVEQLGAVYERVLEYTPVHTATHTSLARTSDERKASGTFYTPREVTAFLVRQTLEPLVAGRTSAEILALRVLDPAMGSGAFLVATCRYLAACAEEALVREGQWHLGDVTLADRLQLRRDIAARCLYGVDLNPTAVQLARLSLWLATLAADKPLSFLDHHLVSGDSLIGATPDDVSRQPPPSGSRRPRPRATPLFDDPALRSVLDAAAQVRLAMAAERDSSAAVVHGKHRALVELNGRDTAIGRWRRVLDLWCAGWFWEREPRIGGSLFQELTRFLLTGRSSLSAAVVEPLLAEADAVAATRHFLHWPLAFPEVFTDGQGLPRRDAGFDAIIGNPPWDMIRGDSGDGAVRGRRQRDARMLIDFVRGAGIYQVASRGHLNRYQLFVERALQLMRRGGRVGLVLPSGFVSDAGAAPLRRHVLARADVDSITGIDNRHAIFPIHRSVRFALVSCTTGHSTRTLVCRFGLTSTADLERGDAAGQGAPLLISRALLARLSGEDDLGLPEMASAHDLRIVEAVTARHPWLSDPRGWGLTFGRELNASDDRPKFCPATPASAGRVVEGKQIEPFRVDTQRSGYALRSLDLLPASARRPRLAYRDVASAGNRLTLIAAMVPAGAVTTHTLFCLKTPLPLPEQHVLCGLFNSFVANYLVRMRVHTHVTTSLLARIPLPVVRTDHPLFRPLLTLSRRLIHATVPVETLEDYAALQALVASLYELTAEDFAHVLSTFPLISEAIREAAYASFNRLNR